MLAEAAKNRKEIVGELRQIILRGRQAGIFTLIAGQRIDATKLGNTPGMPYPWAANRLGHSVKTFMRTYIHVDEDRNEEMLKLIIKD